MAPPMSKGPQKVRGTQDMIGVEAERFHQVVDAFDRVRRLYAFQHIEVPVFEATEVFARTLGESTDVVSKELYTFEDRGGGASSRYERPQKGRFRQFHQLDAEIIGSAEPAADVELIAFAAHLLDEIGLSGSVQLRLNTLGDPATREAWRGALVEHFAARESDLSEESRER